MEQRFKNFAVLVLQDDMHRRGDRQFNYSNLRHIALMYTYLQPSPYNTDIYRVTFQNGFLDTFTENSQIKINRVT